MITYTAITVLALVIMVLFVGFCVWAGLKAKDLGCLGNLFIGLPIMNIPVYPFVLLVWWINR